MNTIFFFFFVFFFFGKLHMHPMSLEPMTHLSFHYYGGKILSESNYDIERDPFF